jgi:hypothetical protein
MTVLGLFTHIGTILAMMLILRTSGMPPLRALMPDVFLHIQADVWPDKFEQMLSECIKCLTNLGVGIYAPNVNFNPHVFSRRFLPRLSYGIYEVPATDCSFWAISADVLRNTPAPGNQ